MQKYSNTIVASFFVWPLTMLMALFFGESASAGFLAIAVLWPLTLGLMLLDKREISQNQVSA